MVADEQGRPVATGREGEILMRPTLPSVVWLGYLGRATDAGDLRGPVDPFRQIHGYFDADGYLYFIGRQPHWLRRKGENVSAREVEMALRLVPGVWMPW